MAEFWKVCFCFFERNATFSLITFITWPTLYYFLRWSIYSFKLMEVFSYSRNWIPWCLSQEIAGKKNWLCYFKVTQWYHICQLFNRVYVNQNMCNTSKIHQTICDISISKRVWQAVEFFSLACPNGKAILG